MPLRDVKVAVVPTTWVGQQILDYMAQIEAQKFVAGVSTELANQYPGITAPDYYVEQINIPDSPETEQLLQDLANDLYVIKDMVNTSQARLPLSSL